MPTDVLQDAVLKVTVTRGEGGRGYNIVGAGDPTIVIGVFPKNNYPESYHSSGVVVKLCDLRLGCNSALAGLKHLNRLEQVLARAELVDSQHAEGILLDTNNNLVEAVFSNVFIVKNNELYTPDLSSSGVAGVMRRFIIEELSTQLKVNVNVCVLSVDELFSADEIFLCNSLNGIWPVTEVIAAEHHIFKIGSITARLQRVLTCL
ncbi:MAG: aminodeoxychorismate lyase [Chitinophagaceae bacterium]|nr:MAG: aminodeoxychorismate lyase [Chitinophagaceae bacterium]